MKTIAGMIIGSAIGACAGLVLSAHDHASEIELARLQGVMQGAKEQSLKQIPMGLRSCFFAEAK